MAIEGRSLLSFPFVVSGHAEAVAAAPGSGADAVLDGLLRRAGDGIEAVLLPADRARLVSGQCVSHLYTRSPFIPLPLRGVARVMVQAAVASLVVHERPAGSR